MTCHPRGSVSQHVAGSSAQNTPRRMRARARGLPPSCTAPVGNFFCSSCNCARILPWRCASLCSVEPRGRVKCFRTPLGLLTDGGLTGRHAVARHQPHPYRSACWRPTDESPSSLALECSSYRSAPPDQKPGRACSSDNPACSRPLVTPCRGSRSSILFPLSMTPGLGADMQLSFLTTLPPIHDISYPIQAHCSPLRLPASNEAVASSRTPGTWHPQLRTGRPV
jgi:hypothetical protein